MIDCANTTPGPWHLERFNAAPVSGYSTVMGGWYLWGATGQSVALVMDHTSTSKADASLVAAAPELRDALRALVAGAGWLTAGVGYWVCGYCANDAPTIAAIPHPDDCPIARGRALLAALEVAP